jgi:hypothetical protein
MNDSVKCQIEPTEWVALNTVVTRIPLNTYTRCANDTNDLVGLFILKEG